MKNIVFLRKYNNYYDRKVKRLETLDEYLAFEYVIKQSINFSPEDGLNTTTTTNWTDEWTPDYVLIVDELGEIISRWFILEFDRTRNGQYIAKLRRDLMADYIEKIKDAPVLVQKANLEMGDPLIYNGESLEYNQIKKGEYLLKDKTNTPWIVGYTALGQEYGVNGTTVSTVIDRGNIIDLTTLPIELENASDPEEGGKFKAFSGDMSFYLGILMQTSDFGQALAKYSYMDNIMTTKSHRLAFLDTPINIRFNQYLGSISNTVSTASDIWYSSLENRKTQLRLAIDAHLEGTGNAVVDKTEYEQILELNGKIVYSSITDKYYRLDVMGNTKKSEALDLGNTANNVSLISVLDDSRQSIINIVSESEEYNQPFQIRYTIATYNIRFVETTGQGTVSTTIKNGHNKLKDGPYNMFAMPYNEANMALTNAIIQQFTPSVIYDIQILPYCPARYMLGISDVNLANGTADVDYNLIKLDSVAISYLLWCKTSSDSFIIPYSIPTGMTAEEVKVINETEFIRLNSPNYNGSFDFNVAKNEGVDYFRVSFTYKPYSPYIQVAPNFKGLYGGEFNDARGLICNGDFSIAMTTDAWKTYEINNKNFQNTFDTQIKTMDYQHKMSMISGGIGSVLGAAGMGAGATLMTGNPIIGAAVGAASAAGGIADLAIGNSVYQNSKQSQKDIFRFSLGNIKARPDTLNKISAYNINNKYYPFVEFYGATDTEKEILLNKIKYEGMTVMKIGTIGEFIDARPEFNYFKGQLIQNGNIDEDFHLVDAIAVELEKGVYL